MADENNLTTLAKRLKPLIKMAAQEVMHATMIEGIDANAINYTPAVVTDWEEDADPGNADDALDQLAERLDDLEELLPIVREMIITFSGVLSISDNPLRIYNKLGKSNTILQVFLSVGTAPVGADIIVDIHNDGTTIFTNQAHRPVITDGASTGYTTTIDVSVWADGTYLTAHIDQIGSGTAGADLVVHIIYN